MMSIFKWTLWQRRWSTVWWSIGVFVLIFVSLIVYPSFKDDADELQKSFENLPDAALQLLGGSTDFFSPIGFLNSQIYFLTLPLIIAILAIGLGSNLLAREEQDKTIESLLARPVSRSRLLAAKGLAGVVILVIVSLVGLVTTVATAKFVDIDVPVDRMILTSLVCFPLTLTFGIIAFLLTATGRGRGASLGIATVVAFGGYIISSLAGTVDWLEGISKVFPFHYYQSEAILRGTYDWNNAWFFAIAIVASAIISWIVFRRRDLA